MLAFSWLSAARVVGQSPLIRRVNDSVPTVTRRRDMALL